MGSGGTFQTFLVNGTITDTDASACQIVVVASGAFIANLTEVPGTIEFNVAFQNNGGNATFSQNATFSKGYSQTQASSVSSFGSGTYVFQAAVIGNALQINGGTFVLSAGQITNPQLPSGYPFQNATIQCNGSIAFFGINTCNVTFTGNLTVESLDGVDSTVYFNGQTLNSTATRPIRIRTRFIGPGTWRFGNTSGNVPSPP